MQGSSEGLSQHSRPAQGGHFCVFSPPTRPQRRNWGPASTDVGAPGGLVTRSLPSPPPPHPRPVPGAQGRWGSGGQEGGARSRRWPGPLAKALVDARQRGLQEPRERALTWPQEATSKITSPQPGASRPLSLGTAKLGAEGHGYFWAGLAARCSPPVPPKSWCKRGGRGRSQPQDAWPLSGAGVLPGDPTLLPSKKPIGIISMSGSRWSHRAVPGLLSHESLCWALGRTKRHNRPQHAGALRSALQQLRLQVHRGGFDCGRNPLCPHGHPLPCRATSPETPRHTVSSLGLRLPHAGQHHHPHNFAGANGRLTNGNLGPREDVRP